jgi:ribonuclease R
LFIEGLVHVTELGADYFQYDETRHELRGERTGIRYQLTDRVTVQVSRVDLDARKIDLRLVNEPSIKTVLKNEARRAESEQGREQPRNVDGKGNGKGNGGAKVGGGKTKAKPARKTAAEPVKAEKTKRAKTATKASENNRTPKAYAKPGKKKR